MTAVYKIKGWEKFQHYKDRNPPWIKLHYELMTSADWVMLADASKLLAVVCMMIASRNDGGVPNNPEYIKRVAYLDKLPDLKPLIRSGFLMLADASKTEQAQAIDTTETEAEAEAEAEEEEKAELEKKKKVTLENLSVEHVAEWLAEKRIQGKYINHDENFILEKFKDYCKSKGKTYVDYIAAYRNAFAWKECQPDGGSFRGRSQSAHDIAGRAWGAVGGINPADGRD